MILSYQATIHTAAFRTAIVHGALCSAQENRVSPMLSSRMYACSPATRTISPPAKRNAEPARVHFNRRRAVRNPPNPPPRRRAETTRLNNRMERSVTGARTTVIPFPIAVVPVVPFRSAVTAFWMITSPILQPACSSQRSARMSITTSTARSMQRFLPHSGCGMPTSTATTTVR